MTSALLTAGAGASGRQAVRSSIERFNAEQATAFRSGADTSLLTRERASFIDRLLCAWWSACGLPTAESSGSVSLLAVGGYGRGELAPFSDIDLLVLVDSAANRHDTNSPPAQADASAANVPEHVAEAPGNPMIEAFVAGLWDFGLEIGHAVRTIDECSAVARQDLTIITSLMESRTLAGDDRLRERMRAATAPDLMWTSAEFYHAKIEEQSARHRRFDHIDYNLEPNVKGGPGGLRDIQTVRWVALRHFATSDLADLTALGFMTQDESDVLQKSLRLLTRVRFGLHLLAQRRDDRLGFAYQRDLAPLFGYHDHAGQLAVEQFMHDYYRHVMQVQVVSDVLLKQFDEAVIRAGEVPTITEIDSRFRVLGDYIEIAHAAVFRDDPSALLEIFVILAHRPDIHGVRASTIRSIREHLHLIDERFRKDPRNTALFMRLLRAPHELVSQLTRMRRYGVLGRYLPEFGQIIGQMQHDLFHIYTVDAHTLQVVRNMRRFYNRTTVKQFPVASECTRRLPKIELLYIAGLYHDIGKGRGGDHSSLGARDVRSFCARHGINGEETELVAWLVTDHLVMSSTAQRQDIHDPEVVQTFAARVGNTNRLDYLYALTVADINATNPTLWNSWRATLLRQLYANTRNYLERGHDANQGAFIETLLESALTRLAERDIDRARVDELWDQPLEDYFQRYDADDFVWQTEEMHNHDLSRGALVLVRDLGHLQEGGTEVILYTRNQKNLFAASVAALDQMNLSIQDARIHTTAMGLCFNTYVVLGADGQPIGDDVAFIDHIRDKLTRELRRSDSFPQVVKRRVPRQLKQFAIATTAVIEPSASSDAGPSQLRVTAADRPGLLARLGLIFMEFGINVHAARITTLGERVEDVFYISDGDVALSDPVRSESLRARICTTLDEEL